MAFTIDHYNKVLSENWRFDNMRGDSRIAVLFQNELKQDGGAFKAIVEFPVMKEASTQESWNQQTGFKETDATEETVKIELLKNFTSYTKIAKVNVPASWETWATGKIQTLNRQEARELDNFVLEKITTGVKKENIIESEEITKDNVVAIIKKLAKEADKHKFKLEDAILFGSSDVATAIVNSKISNVSQNIENTSVVVSKILNRYNFVEANIDDAGFQLIAVLPTAFAWVSAVETPLQAGEYTQGSFFGQIFTVVNKFYNGEILMPEHIVGLKIKDAETAPTTLEKPKSLKNLKNKVYMQATVDSTPEELKTVEQDLTKAETLEEIIAVEEAVEEAVEKKLNSKSGK